MSILKPIYEERDDYAERIYAGEQWLYIFREAKLDEIEAALSVSQWLSGGNTPGAADVETYEAVR